MTGTASIARTPPVPEAGPDPDRLAGPYIAGDVLSRFLRGESRGVLYPSGGGHPCGPDDHRGRPGARAPHRDAGYARTVRGFLRRLYDDGHLVARTNPLPYCVPCERWLHAAHVVGRCPHCGAAAHGNACRACGRPNDCGDLVGPRCAGCGRAAVNRPCERLYFPLRPHTERLVAHWSGGRGPAHLRALYERMAADGLPDIAATHPADRGAGVPVVGFEDQRVHTPFELAAEHLPRAGRARGGEGGRDERPAVDGAGRTRPVPFPGVDGGHVDAVLFPALYAACGGSGAPAAVLRADGSRRPPERDVPPGRRPVVTAEEVIAECGGDVLRHRVCSERPQGGRAGYDRPALEVTRRHLDAVWNGWLDGLFDAVEAECGGRVPEVVPAGADWERLRAQLLASLAELRAAYGPSGFAPHRAVALLDGMVRRVTGYAHAQASRAQRPDGGARRRAVLAAQLAVASAIAAWAAPVMPAGAARLAEALGVDTDRPVTAAALEVPRPGRRLTRPDGPVFGDVRPDDAD